MLLGCIWRANLLAYSECSYIANSDSTALVRSAGSVNTKIDVVWTDSVHDAGDLVGLPQEKICNEK